MRKLLLCIVIITLLPMMVFASDTAKVPLIVIPGHENEGPILYLDYQELYSSDLELRDYMPLCGGHNKSEEQYKQWLIANIGYLMDKYNSWYVYALDDNTKITSKVVQHTISTNPKRINITEELILTMKSHLAGKRSTVLMRGSNIYVLDTEYLNEAVFHLLCR